MEVLIYDYLLLTQQQSLPGQMHILTGSDLDICFMEIHHLLTLK
jgi:hypothetical protein